MTKCCETGVEPFKLMVAYAEKWQPKKLIPDFKFKSPLQHGWMLPYLIELDALSWRRWEHWCKVAGEGRLIDEPIPQIKWSNGIRCNGARKMFEASLNQVTRYGGWQGWGSYQNMDYFLDWLLFGFGNHANLTEPEVPSGCEGASERLYQTFDLAPWLAQPNDYLGDMLAENQHGRQQGFFPTPMEVCVMMVQMQMADGDMRDKTVFDPALGTGRMLLAASNHSYRLHGMDISATVIKVCLVNGYVMAPWMVKPFHFWKEERQIMEVQSEIAPKLLTMSGKTKQLQLI